MSEKEKDADIPGRCRSGTVISYEVREALGRITLHTTTTNSRTIAVLTEEWLVKMGLLAESARVHTKADYEALTVAAKQSAKTDGRVEKMP